MNRADRAEELFRQGYNCSQSVFAAFADAVGMTTEEAAKLAKAERSMRSSVRDDYGCRQAEGI